MKKLLLSLTVFSLSIINAQNISDYKYIYVPNDFKDFPANKYKLKTQLVSILKQKNYAILDQAESLPAELQQNPCSFATADIEDNSSMIRNRVLVKLKDCKNTVISEYKGMSMEKEFEIGFADALKKALVELPSSSPKDLPIISNNITVIDPVKQESVKQTKDVEKKEVKPSTTIENKVISKPSNSAVQIYSNGKLNLQKVQIGADQFILVSSDSPVPYATFKNTAKQDVYRVTLENGTSTLGYLENNNIVLEIPNGDDFIKETFIKQ